MLTRPTMSQVMMVTAHAVAERSTCRRAQVGCVVATMDLKNIVAFGYNGNARGLANACDRDEPGNCGCLHAEENALIKAPYDAGALWMFTTHAPCVNCSKRILNSRVARVTYADGYRYSSASVPLLIQGQVEVSHLVGAQLIQVVVA